jgi:peroxisomal 3,2-trans-enoyl-CoA isomerase
MYISIAKDLRKISLDDDIKCVLLLGAGDYFSSGNDLSNFSKLMHPLAIAKLSRDILHEFVSSFIECRKPIIVAVNGPAIGIATTVLGLCDKIFCAEAAYFKTPFAELGQAPEACSSFTFPRIMGGERANDVLWKSRKLSSKEALEFGLVQSLHANAEETINSAMDYARKLAAKPNGSEELVRRIQREGIVAELERVNLEECDVLQCKWISRECFEALARYLESRKMKIAAFMLRYCPCVLCSYGTYF